MIAGKFLVAGFLLGMPTALLADKGPVHLTVDNNAEPELQLELVQSPLAQALDEIANKTGLLIHYPALPEGLFSTICKESSVTGILNCLFKSKADLIFRYAHPLSKVGQQQNPLAEVWVLGVNFDLASDAGQDAILYRTANTQTLYRDDTEKLLETATENNPQHRADAVAMLAARGQASDLSIHKVLEAALSDQSAEVRAQAVLGLVKNAGDGATAILQSALQDSDASVRLMAVDNAGENPALLQQALDDSDETVRAYAAIKLEAISVH